METKLDSLKEYFLRKATEIYIDCGKALKIDLLKKRFKFFIEELYLIGQCFLNKALIDDDNNNSEYFDTDDITLAAIQDLISQLPQELQSYLSLKRSFYDISRQ